jgi:hypothetical protein
MYIYIYTRRAYNKWSTDQPGICSQAYNWRWTESLPCIKPAHVEMVSAPIHSWAVPIGKKIWLDNLNVRIIDVNIAHAVHFFMDYIYVSSENCIRPIYWTCSLTTSAKKRHSHTTSAAKQSTQRTPAGTMSMYVCTLYSIPLLYIAR